MAEDDVLSRTRGRVPGDREFLVTGEFMLADGFMPADGFMLADDFAVTTLGKDPLRIGLAGELDLVSADDAWWSLQAAAKPGEPVVLDLARLSFIDGEGVQVIELLLGHLAGAPLTIVNAAEMAHRLLRLTGVADRPAVELHAPRAASTASWSLATRRL